MGVKILSIVEIIFCCSNIFDSLFLLPFEHSTLIVGVSSSNVSKFYALKKDLGGI